MAFHFEELTPDVRQSARSELASEISNPPVYFSSRLTAYGREKFYALVDDALEHGSDEMLEHLLTDQALWNLSEEYDRAGIIHTRKVNFVANGKMMAITEFNTWYVRGLCRLLLDAGVLKCEVYRAAGASAPRTECLNHDGQTFRVQDIYDGHRVRYWPEPGQTGALSIPVGPNCHHSIRRIQI